jgi:hypothetical protein
MTEHLGLSQITAISQFVDPFDVDPFHRNLRKISDRAGVKLRHSLPDQ